ncbi:Protein LNK1 [Zea mays]|uniref:Protein LNK1 n=1 Tax=Zea mays TaxID=4577 RepID=A0A3L6F1L6_MAIZE|nr:Protein LNK1 [Zea mays]
MITSLSIMKLVPAVRDISFRKLQHGMNQLDLATRGRIRDSLYRLASSLEQRHCGGLGSSGSNRFASGGGGFAETQADPMDRSVARLLLQKPSYRKTAPPHRRP